MMPQTFKQFLVPLLGGIIHLMVLSIHAQGDQSGFISIDCGLVRNSSYIEMTTKLKYISDAGFVDTGETKSIQKEYNYLYQQPYAPLRSFPEGTRNCYKINVMNDTKYSIRTSFVYGNYDGEDKLPEFQLHLGPDLWDTVRFDSVSSSTHKELIHIPMRNYVHICLVNTGSGVPFISVIELRPLPNEIYETETGSLALLGRDDTGLQANQSGYRYPADIYDRFWYNYADRGDWTQIHTLSPIEQKSFQIPSTIMSTTATPKNPTDPLTIIFELPKDADQNAEYYQYLHFAELEKLQANQSRQMNITRDGEVTYSLFSPHYLTSDTIYSKTAWRSFGESVNISMIRTENSTLPPILNAYEIYKVKNFTTAETNQKDVEAIINLKTTYKIGRNWQGDPCAPQEYQWEGVNCSYPEFESPRIISLILSSSGLTGGIAPYISNLTMIQSLDLSNNNLTGSIPEFLSKFQNLSVINLGKNNLTGSIPVGLTDRMNNGLLVLSLCANPNLSGNVSCKVDINPVNNNLEKSEKKHKFLIPVVVSIAGILILLLVMAAIRWWSFKRKRQNAVILGDVNDAKFMPQYAPLESTKRKFTYSDILTMTNNLQRALGRGGFGTVYHGYMDNTQVAVKMLSPSSFQGLQQFQAEVDLLMRVHHKNLTSLVGYCKDETHIGLVYEYMANGNLSEHLLDRRSNVFSWEGRLQIATDAAQGLEYLHYGCKPPIMHRDVKTSNILLNENFQAKLSDFGLSRNFPTSDGTQTSSLIAGTPGYLDPEYFASNRPNEKSDVYSFGVVLLEIITGKPAISRAQERIHISQWVGSKLTNGDINSIVDSRLEGVYNSNSVWKAVEIAMACLSTNTTKRPSMSQVVMDLKECLATEQQNHVAEFEYTSGFMPNNSIAMVTPSVR